MAQPTAQEQLMLELVNRARLDPAAEAARLGISLNQGLPAGTIDATSKAPLAMNALLIDSARAHSSWMIATDTFSHTGAGGSSPTARMQAAGYQFTGSWRSGENISWSGSTGAVNLTTTIFSQHDSLFRSAGHRANLLQDGFAEAGIGQISGQFMAGGTNYNASMITQNFAKSGTAVFVTGVVYNDTDKNSFYSVGEAVANVKVTVSGSTQTGAAGGYQLNVGTGTKTVTFDDGKGLARVTATLTGENAKLDYVNSDTILSSVSMTLVSGVTRAKLLGLDNLSLTGSAGNDVLTGNKGNNVIVGGNGGDALFGGAGNDVLSGGASSDRLVGQQGADRLTGGLSKDLFTFNSIAESTATARDTILDFKQAELDRIELSLIDANTLVSGNQAFKFMGERAAFTGTAGELRYADSGGTTIVYADVNGDRAADFVLVLNGDIALKSTDFVL